MPVVTALDGVARKPSSAKPSSATKMDGTVVQSCARMWVNRSTPASCALSTVVSDSGELLSPKYAPEMTAPAVIAGDTPTSEAIPTSPTPIVPAVVHELPMPTEMAAQTAALAT